MGFKPRNRDREMGLESVGGIKIPIQKNTVVNEQPVVTEKIVERKVVPKQQEVKKVAWKNAPAKVTTAEGKVVGNTTLSDGGYISSLKIDSVDRYNELLGKKAFHPGNPEVKSIAKKLGIAAHSGKPRKVRSDKGVKRVGKDPLVENTIVYDPTVSPSDVVMQMAFGNNGIGYGLGYNLSK